MTTIARLRLDIGAAGLWDRVAAEVQAWLGADGPAWRDAVVLLPFVQLLPEARRAFARRGTWLPRIETTRTLAAALGPPAAVPPGQVSFDPTLDGLNAAALLRAQGWGAAWARRDARGFEQAVEALVATAHDLVRSAAIRPPPDRAAHWAGIRERLGPVPGPGGTERLLARVALEWASLAPAPATDRLFLMAPPSAWVAVEAGGSDPLARALMAQARVPGLLIETDPEDAALFAGVPRTAPPALAVREHFEDEAQAAAAQVWAHVGAGEVPVALIAADRVLVRRVRALLERHALRLLDETGWKLSTTRAAATVMGLLLAARPDAGTDALLDWLKAGTGDEVGLEALEAACRRHKIARVAALPAAPLDPVSARLWHRVAPVLAGLAGPGAARRQPLAAWIEALRDALSASGALEVLQGDDAGAQVLAELRLGGAVPASGAWAASAARIAMSAAEFAAWVDGVLERATFRPAASFEGAADVIVTPLAQALLRPFAAAVLPGADARHLGGAHADTSLLGDALAGAIGLPTAADRRDAEARAFARLAALPRVTLLRRRADGNEPLADSPLVERLGLALAEEGGGFAAWHDPRETVAVVAAPVRRSAPAAAGLLPARLSASACEALRACPYRFFALYMLGLREDDELERDVDKRDYGNWLHEVLHAFHLERGAPADAAIEVARLHRIALERQAANGMTDADFLPYAASFESFAPRYVEWMHRRDAEGLRWLRGEEAVELHLPALGGTVLRGVIDRVDVRAGGTPAPLDVIDYKTGSAEALREKVKMPLEDTQLAFYAALTRSQTEAPIRAFYVALDGTRGLREFEHPDVETSAGALLEGLADDLGSIRAGAGLPPLGSGATCDHCVARGICRRDHWNDA